MRIFGLVGFVLVLLIVGFLVKKQVIVHEKSATSGSSTTSPGSDAAARTWQMQQDIRRSLDAAMRTSRDVPNEP